MFLGFAFNLQPLTSNAFGLRYAFARGGRQKHGESMFLGFAFNLLPLTFNVV